MLTLEQIVVSVYLTAILVVNRWNQLDLIIILLSIVGIVLEEMESALPINPTIIRVMRVLRIARGGGRKLVKPVLQLFSKFFTQL